MVMESYKWQLEINMKVIGYQERKMDLVILKIMYLGHYIFTNGDLYEG